MLRSMKCPQRNMRVLCFKVEGADGSPEIIEGKYDGAVTDNGVGDYTVTYTHAFTRLPICVVGAHTVGIVKIHAISVSAVQVKIYAVDGVTPAEGDVSLVVIGGESADQV